MQLKISHTTTYAYDSPVTYGLQKVRLRPRLSHQQQVVDWSVDVTGGKIETGYLDHYGNHVDLVSTTPGAQSITITAGGTINTQDTAGIFGQVYTRAPLWHFAKPTALTAAGPQIQEMSETLQGSKDLLGSLHAITAEILEKVTYDVGETGADTPAETAMTLGSGVCQDHAHILIAASRAAGLPARYVSGYLLLDDRIDQDASHAWAEVHVPDLGWVGFDVSNGICPDERYVRVAVGRDAHDSAPISGLRIGAGDEALTVSLQVQQ